MPSFINNKHRAVKWGETLLLFWGKSILKRHIFKRHIFNWSGSSGGWPLSFCSKQQQLCVSFAGRKPAFLVSRSPERSSIRARFWKPGWGWVPRNHSVVGWKKKKQSSTSLIRIIIAYIKPKRDEKHGAENCSKWGCVWKSRVFTLSSANAGRDHFLQLPDHATHKHIKLPL